jgi:hypothetical protein
MIEILLTVSIALQVGTLIVVLIIYGGKHG